MKILIIYEFVPERTSLYLVNVSLEEWEWIQKTHLYYENMRFDETEAENEEACRYLDEWLQNHQPLEPVKGQPVPLEGIEAVVLTGFLL